MKKENVNILHTEWSQGWGGQEIRILSESIALKNKGYSLHIACQPDSPLFKQAAAAGIPAIPLRLRKGLTFASVFNTMRIIKKFNINLVHTHSSVDAWKCGIAAKLLGLPVVRSRHISTPVSTSPLTYFAYMKLANCVISSGKEIKRALVQRNKMNPEKIISIPAGVDITRFYPRAASKTLQQEFGITSSDYVVGIIAVLRGWKGHQYLIQAIKKLVDQGLSIKLIIAGAGPQEKNIRTLIKAEKLDQHVILAGHRQDVPECISVMDVVVLPSVCSEATSQVLPQAMAMKKPVIATDVGGLPEVVIHKKTGLLIPPKDETAICNALSTFYNNTDLAKKMAEQGYEYCMKNFTFEQMVNSTEAVYIKLLPGTIEN
ncbi:MAG: glycosyltransferase family 4 protein [Gammaproteobacteria bacterium]|nr:glycosyltransferase family 4 protein [Gammaproteobacteria bacterium]